MPTESLFKKSLLHRLARFRPILHGELNTVRRELELHPLEKGLEAKIGDRVPLRMKSRSSEKRATPVEDPGDWFLPERPPA